MLVTVVSGDKCVSLLGAASSCKAAHGVGLFLNNNQLMASSAALPPPCKQLQCASALRGLLVKLLSGGMKGGGSVSIHVAQGVGMVGGVPKSNVQTHQFTQAMSLSLSPSLALPCFHAETASALMSA